MTPHTFMRTSLRFLAIFAIVGLSACSSSDDPAPESPTPPAPTSPRITTTDTTSQSIDSAGGTLQLTASNGTVFHIAIPAQALSTATTVTLTSRPTTGTQHFNLLLQPAGLILNAGSVATITITLPSGASLPTTGGLAYGGAPIAFTRLNDGRLQAELPSFVNSTVTPSAAASAHSLKSTHSTQGAAASISCGNAPGSQILDDDGVVGVDHIEADLYGQCMVASIHALTVNERYVEAIQVALSVAAYLQQVGAGNPTPHLQQASTAACLGSRAALNRGINTPVTNMGTLHSIARPILFWESVVQKLGATCPNIAVNEYQTVINAKTTEAEAYYQQQASQLTDTQSSAYAAARNEAAQGQQTEREVLALNPSTGVRTTLNSQIVERAQPALIEALLQAPWSRCRNANDYEPLITLMNELNSPAAVRQAAHYCGVQLSGESRDASNTTLATLSALGGINATTQQSTGALQVANDGSVRLNGPIAALGCPANSGGSEALELRLNGVVIQSLNSPPYINNTWAQSMTSLLQAAGLNPQTFTVGTLTVERTGTPCNGFWGATPSPLLSITLNTGVCAPSNGQAFCVTVVAPYDFMAMSLPLGPNDRGEVVLRYHAGSQRWHRGNVTPLSPTNFSVVGIDNSGAIGGNILRSIQGGGSVNDAAVIPAGSNNATTIKATVVASCTTNPCPDIASTGQAVRLASISPNGRLLIHTDRSGRVQQNNGDCLFEPAYNLHYCRTYTWEAASPPSYSLSTVHSSSIPNTILEHHPIGLWDDETHGPVGRVTRYTPSLCSGSLCATNTANYAMQNFAPNLNLQNREYVYVDSRGNRVIGTPNTLEPANQHLPTGWFVYAMGTQSDALICSGTNSGTARLLNIHTGAVAADVQLPIEITSGNTTHTLNACWSNWGSNLAKMDRHGRFVALASNNAETNIVIVTPAGKPMP